MNEATVPMHQRLQRFAMRALRAKEAALQTLSPDDKTEKEISRVLRQLERLKRERTVVHPLPGCEQSRHAEIEQRGEAGERDKQPVGRCPRGDPRQKVDRARCNSTQGRGDDVE